VGLEKFFLVAIAAKHCMKKTYRQRVVLQNSNEGEALKLAYSSIELFRRDWIWISA